MSASGAARQTPDELAALKKRAREFWGDDIVNAGDRVYSPEMRRYVLAEHYLPTEPKRDGLEAEITSKVCSGCGLDMGLSYYSRSRGGRGGVKSKCKTCCADYAREYGSTSHGKAARARAQTKFRAHLAAEERQKKEKAAFIEAVSKTQAGRALLNSVGMTREASQEDGNC